MLKMSKCLSVKFLLFNKKYSIVIVVSAEPARGGIKKLSEIDNYLKRMDYYKLKVLNNKRKIIVIAIAVLIIGGLVFYYFYFYQNSKEVEIIEDGISNMVQDELKDSNNILYVDIKGYVERPGVYSFYKSDNARINDVILKAGGLKKGADTSLINLSKKVEDEMTIIIYSTKEVNDYLNGKNELQNKLIMCEEKLKNNACMIKDDNGKKLININYAEKDELMTLAGIGEAKASAIIAYREKSLFKSIEELLNVEGIGENLFESIKEYLTV